MPNKASRLTPCLPAAMAVGLSFFAATPAFAHEEHRHQVLGRVHFPVTCTPEAQAAFDEGMKLQHSFWYKAASDKFLEVLSLDPSCVMAYWGRAMSLLYNPFTPPPKQNLAQGLDALEQARKIGAKSPRETDYIAALLEFYRDHDARDHRSRVLAYEKAMESLAARYPDDPEARIYHALALNVGVSPTDKTYAKQLKAAEILEAEWQRQPDHPGIAHYLIHTYDYPPLAQQGLRAALRYADIAPDAPHALHMPSHIFTRVGYWAQSAETNRRSATTARREGAPDDELHALDYMVYAYLQSAQDGAARQVLDDLGYFAGRKTARNAAPWSLAAIPARYAMERSAWSEAAELKVNRSNFAYTDAITHFARAVGSARSGKPEAASADLEALGGIVQTLRGKDDYWAEQVDIARQAAEAWVAFASGRREAAIESMRQAAERESKTEKHPITPGPLAPAREQLAEMLLGVDRPVEALAEFEAVQVTEPNRFRAVYGAGRAAEAAGNRDAAKRHYARLVELAAKADTVRPEVQAARAYLEK